MLTATLLTSADIAGQLKIKPRQFNERISKRPDFPRPCLVLGPKEKRWAAVDIDKWLLLQKAKLAR